MSKHFEVIFRAKEPGGICPDFPQWLEMQNERGYAQRHLTLEGGYWVARIIKKITPDAHAKINNDDWEEVRRV